jgi:hypothetical protein
VNPDGTLPEVRPHRKQYRPIADRTEEVRAAIDADVARSMQRGR